MENINLARKNLVNALDKLEEAVNYLENLKKGKKIDLPEFIGYEAFRDSLRDSLIQRFEFCVDLFWKYLKRYLEVIVKNPPNINGPNPVIKASCKAKLITEIDAEVLLEMIKKRNLTSHIYKEEIADQISLSIPNYYLIMRKYSDKLIG